MGVRLGSGEVQVWFADLDAAHDSGLVAICAEERASARSLSVEKSRRRSATAHGILRVLLSKLEGGTPEGLSFGVGPGGKPFVPGSSLKFSISHSERFALYAISRNREVGVDIEPLRTIAEKRPLARRFLSPESFLALSSTDNGDSTRQFFRSWTRQEALLKGVGVGVAFMNRYPAPESGGVFSVELPFSGAKERWHLHDLELGPGLAGALAVEGPRCNFAMYAFAKALLPN